MEIHIERFDGGRGARVHPRGAADVHQTADLYDAFQELVKDRQLERVVVDFGAVESMDSSAIATLSVAFDQLRNQDKRLVAENLADDHRRALDLMPRASKDYEPKVEATPNLFEAVGQRWYDAREELDEFYEVFTDIVFGAIDLFRGRVPPKGSVTEQSVRVGVDSFPIVGLLSFLLGLILAFQSAHQLRQFGANIYVANLVAISMVREFGPMMTAIILAGRSGSSMAAELGTMRIQEEVDALRTMGIDPTRYLVLPRMIAITIVQPALTLMSMFIGICGGFLIARLYLDVSSSIYVNKAMEAIDMGDFTHGLGKSVVFAWIIGSIACYAGLKVEKGAAGVGRATTKAVVSAIFMIIVADSIFTTTATLL